MLAIVYREGISEQLPWMASHHLQRKNAKSKLRAQTRNNGSRGSLLFAGDFAPAWMPQVSLPGKLRGAARLLSKSSLRRFLLHSLQSVPPSQWKSQFGTMACSLFPLQELSQMFKEADAKCVNLECVLSEQGTPVPGKRFALGARPANVFSLLDHGIDVVNVANNHVLDLGPGAVSDTISTLSSHGIDHCGLQLHEEQGRQAATLVKVGGCAIGLLSYVDPNLVDPSPDVFFAHLPRPYGLDLDAVVRDLRYNQSRADLLVVQLHWGTEWSHVVRADQRTLARSLIDAGAAAVIGHHPHVVQDYEEYKGGLICYSLGNLFFNLPGIQGSRARIGFLAKLIVAGHRIEEYRIIPTEFRAGRAVLAAPVTFDGWIPGNSSANASPMSLCRFSNHLSECQIDCEGEEGHATFDKVREFALHDIPLPEAYVNGSSHIVAKSREFYGYDLRHGVLCHMRDGGAITITSRLPLRGMLHGYVGVPNWFVDNRPPAEARCEIRVGSRPIVTEIIAAGQRNIGPIAIESAMPLSITIRNCTQREAAVGFDFVVS